MSDDIACIGVCIVDPDTGICQGCGRGPAEILWAPPDAGNAGTRASICSAGGAATCKKNPATPLSAAQYPLPSQVAREAEQPSD